MPRELLLLRPGEVALSEYDPPPMGETSLRLRTLFSGVSHGTEMLLYRGEAPKYQNRWDEPLRLYHEGSSSTASRPQPLGYESVVRVEAVGGALHGAAEGLVPGDLLWIDAPHRETHVIDTRRPPPFWRFGADCDPKLLTFFALSRVALGAVHDAEPALGGSAVVSGLGTIGQLCVQMLRLCGVRTIFGLDRHPERLELAARFGAIPVSLDDGDPAEAIKSRFGAVDFAIEASGAYPGLATALRCVAPMGRLVVVSSYGNQANGIQLGHEFHRNRITLVSSMTVNDCPHPKAPLWSFERLNREAAALLAAGTLDVGPLITSLAQFDSAPEVYRAIAGAKTPPLKTVFKYD